MADPPDRPRPMPSLSVILPTRNPHPGRLARTLAGLAAQSLASDRWELVLVDNGSCPPVDPSLLAILPTSARVVREHRPGLTSARLTGIAATTADVLVFVDDDNVLAPHYLESALDFLAAHTDVGAVGGRIKGEFETPPPAWAEEFRSHLAVRDFGDKPLISPSGPDAAREYPWCAPIGAGMVIRRVCAERYAAWCRTNSFLNDRTAGRLGGCGDTELVIRGSLQAGLASAYTPTLELTHIIPVNRLEFRYLAKLIHTCSHDWARLCVSFGYEKTIPAWSVPLRIVRAFFRRRGWSRAGWLATCQAAGHFRGRVHSASGSTS